MKTKEIGTILTVRSRNNMTWSRRCKPGFWDAPDDAETVKEASREVEGSSSMAGLLKGFNDISG